MGRGDSRMVYEEVQIGVQLERGAVVGGGGGGGRCACTCCASVTSKSSWAGTWTWSWTGAPGKTDVVQEHRRRQVVAAPSAGRYRCRVEVHLQAQPRFSVELGRHLHVQVDVEVVARGRVFGVRQYGCLEQERSPWRRSHHLDCRWRCGRPFLKSEYPLRSVPCKSTGVSFVLGPPRSGEQVFWR